MGRKSNAEVVLSALLAGQEVEIDGFNYRFFRKGDEFEVSGDLYEALETGVYTKMIGHSAGTGETRDVWIAAQMSLGRFVESCESLSFDEIFFIGSQKVLSEMSTDRLGRKSRGDNDLSR